MLVLSEPLPIRPARRANDTLGCYTGGITPVRAASRSRVAPGNGSNRVDGTPTHSIDRPVMGIGGAGSGGCCSACCRTRRWSVSWTSSVRASIGASSPRWCRAARRSYAVRAHRALPLPYPELVDRLAGGTDIAELGAASSRTRAEASTPA